MYHKIITRIFNILTISVLLTSMMGVPGQAKASSVPTEKQKTRREEQKASDVPEGLNASDWGEIKSMLPSGDPISPQARLTGETNDEQFGSGVAVYDNTVVVGDLYHNDGRGQVYVFTHEGNSWGTEPMILTASNPDPDDHFGVSVAISGDTIVVGSDGEDSGASGINGDQGNYLPNRDYSSGAAYIFVRNGVSWEQQAYLKASNAYGDDQFGISVAISGDTVLVGAWGEDSNATSVNGNQDDDSKEWAGAAYVFVRQNNTWSQQAYLKGPNSMDFGYSVAISGDTAIVGAPGEYGGSAHIFTRSNNTWSREATLKGFNTKEQDDFGDSVAIFQDTAVVGSQVGAYIFEKNGNSWNEEKYINLDRTIISVGIFNKRVVIGGGWSAERGWAYEARIFLRQQTGWNEQQVLTGSNNSNFGTAVAIYGENVIVGAYSENAAYIYNLFSPVIVVHGVMAFAKSEEAKSCEMGIQRYNGSNATLTVNLDGYSHIAAWLAENGYDVWIAHVNTRPVKDNIHDTLNGNSGQGTPPIQKNAQCLSEQIQTVWASNPSPISIVAHSMGGLVSRGALKILPPNVKVSALYTMGTPHDGVALQQIALLTLNPIVTVGFCELEPFLCQLSPIYMVNQYNPQNPNRKDVKYTFIGGKAGENLNAKIVWLSGEGSNDGIVGLDSALGRQFPTDWTKNSLPRVLTTHATHPTFSDNDETLAYFAAPNGEYTHTYQCIHDLMLNQTDSPNCNDDVTSQEMAMPLENTIENSSITTTKKYTGRLEAEATSTITITSDGEQETTFYLNWISGAKPNFSLVSPSQVEITPEYANANPTLVQYENGSGSGILAPYQAYTITNGQPGTWQIHLTGGSEGIDYQVFAMLKNSVRTLKAELNQQIYQNGASALIKATLTNNNTGISGATVNATVTSPDGNETLVALDDNQDGTYTGNYIVPPTPGYMIVSVEASGNDQSVPYTRSEILTAGIAPNDLTLTGIYGEEPIEDATGQYEKLAFDLGIDLAKASNYSISAELYSGEELVAQTGSLFDLQAGSQTVRLFFDGQDIRDSGFDGPYTVTNLFVTPIDIGITAQTGTNILQSEPYLHTDFGLREPPGDFGKITPADTEKDVVLSPTLTWVGSANATSYEYCYDTINNNACDTAWISVDAGTSATLENLARNTTYYWQVKATSLDGSVMANTGGWFSFTTLPEPPGGFSKSSPTDGASNQSRWPVLMWSSSNNATEYEYCYDTTNDNLCDNDGWRSNGSTSAQLYMLTANTTYYWQVRAMNASGSIEADANTWWSFTTVADAPGAFNKSTPLNGATNQSTSLTISWGASANASSYEYCYSTTNDGNCAAWISAGASTSASPSGLAAETTYYWQVRAKNTSGTVESDSNTWWSFTTVPNPPATFSKSAPANGATNQPLSLNLSWDTSSGAESYKYCLDTTNDNACNATWTSVGTGTSVPLGGLARNTTYYWQVQATNPGGTTDANANTWWSFTTIPDAPAAFGKVSPTNGANNQPLSSLLSWNNSSGASNYEYCYDTTNNSTCDTTWNSNGVGTSATLSNLTDNTIYYWQVRASNPGGTTYANTNTWWSFKTRSAPIVFKSNATQDGFILESSESSGTGGTVNSASTIIRVGDDAQNRQYRSILSFSTASLPDNAVIVSATLKIKKQGLTGTDPFTTHDYLVADICKPYLGDSSVLESSDFNHGVLTTPCGMNAAGIVGANEINGFNIANIKTSAFSYINKTGLTQFRLRFQLDDDNNLLADFLQFFSGDHTNTTYHPVLEIEYYIP